MFSKIKNCLLNILFWTIYCLDYVLIFGVKIISVYDQNYEYNKNLTLKIRACYLLCALFGNEFNYEMLRKFIDLNKLNIVWYESGSKRLTVLDILNKKNMKTEKYSNYIDLTFDKSYDASDCQEFFGYVPEHIPKQLIY